MSNFCQFIATWNTWNYGALQICNSEFNMICLQTTIYILQFNKIKTLLSYLDTWKFLPHISSTYKSVTKHWAPSISKILLYCIWSGTRCHDFHKGEQTLTLVCPLCPVGLQDVWFRKKFDVKDPRLQWNHLALSISHI